MFKQQDNKKNIARATAPEEPQRYFNAKRQTDPRRSRGEYQVLEEQKGQDGPATPTNTFIKITKGIKTFFKSKYMLGTEGRKALARHFHCSSEEQFNSRSNFIFDQGYTHHPHPVGAISRSLMHHYIHEIYELEYQGRTLDIGASLTRVSGMICRGEELVKKTHNMCPILDARDLIRRDTHARHLRDDIDMCQCQATRDITAVCDKCSVVENDYAVLTSIDSIYYHGVFQFMAFNIANYNHLDALDGKKYKQAVGYFAFNDYADAWHNGKKAGLCADGESAFSIDQRENVFEVTSFVNGNPAPYRHQILNTPKNSKSWQMMLMYQTVPVRVFVEVLEEIQNGDVPYKLCRMFAWYLADMPNQDEAINGIPMVPNLMSIFVKSDLTPPDPPRLPTVCTQQMSTQTDAEVQAMGTTVPVVGLEDNNRMAGPYLNSFTEDPYNVRAVSGKTLDNGEIRVKQYYGRAVSESFVNLNLVNLTEEYMASMSRWQVLMNNYNAWLEKQHRNRNFLKQHLVDNILTVELMITKPSTFYECLIPCTSTIQLGNTYSAPVSEVLSYILTVGVKSDATSIIYAQLADLKKNGDFKNLVKIPASTDAVIIAVEILSQLKCRLLHYQATSDNFKKAHTK